MFLGTGGITQKFIDDMATIALNFIRDTTAYETELSASDSVAFTAGLACIQGWIANLIKEASAFKLTYEGAQKKFTGILERVEKEVKEYLDTRLRRTARPSWMRALTVSISFQMLSMSRLSSRL